MTFKKFKADALRAGTVAQIAVVIVQANTHIYVHTHTHMSMCTYIHIWFYFVFHCTLCENMDTHCPVEVEADSRPRHVVSGRLVPDDSRLQQALLYR